MRSRQTINDSKLPEKGYHNWIFERHVIDLTND
jgi:hypothetical protein